MEKITFLRLIDKYLAGTASPQEQTLAEEYYKRLECPGVNELPPQQEETLKETMYANIRNGMEEATTPVVPMRRRLFIRIASVAAAGLVLSVGYWMFTNNETPISARRIAAVLTMRISYAKRLRFASLIYGLWPSISLRTNQQIKKTGLTTGLIILKKINYKVIVASSPH